MDYLNFDKILDNKIKLYNKFFIVSGVSIFLMFFNPTYTILINIGVLIAHFVSNFFGYKVIPNYIEYHHKEDFRDFQKSHFLLVMTNQRYTMFLNSKFFNPSNEENTKIYLPYKKLEKRIYLLHFGSFALIIISVIYNRLVFKCRLFAICIV